MSIFKHAILGSPVAHSLSPEIYQSLADIAGIELNYERLDVSPDDFIKTLIELKNNNYKGVNITSPLKKIAFNEVDELTDRARHAGAVNTITFDEYGRIMGDTTDGIGFIRDLTTNNAVSISNTNILIMGAGGAARSIVRPLFGFSPKKIIIANRTKPKAVDLVDYFKPWGKIKYQPYEKLKRAKFDIIINTTSAGLHGEVPPLPEGFSFKDSICYDLNYAAAAKPFLTLAKAQGAHSTIDGLGMLIELAAECFFIWYNKRVDTLPIIRKMQVKIREQECSG